MRSMMKSLGIAATAVMIGACGTQTDTTDQAAQAAQAKPMLNLSHIQCTADGQVDVHFVLLFWGDSTPPALSGTYNGGSFGPTAQNKHSGNVWHYDVFLPSGFIDITSATVGSVSLHNPSEYAGVYNCGGGVQCDATPPVAGVLCTAHPLTNPGLECGFFGLNPIGKDDNLTGLSFTATMDAFVAIVKSGTHPCGGGNSAYNIYVNVVAGDTLSTPADQSISHVTYCGCPPQ